MFEFRFEIGTAGLGLFFETTIAKCIGLLNDRSGGFQPPSSATLSQLLWRLEAATTENRLQFSL